MSATPILTEDTPLQVLRRTWQPVALSSALETGTSVPFCLLETEIVVARLPGGLLAVADACPHKGFRLSQSPIYGDEWRCAYHGWRFDNCGRCVGIPSLPEASANKLEAASLRPFGVRERYGFIWVQLESDAAFDIPDIPEFENANWTYLVAPATPFEAGWRREVENFLDMTHFAFAHAATLGQAAEPRLPAMQIVARAPDAAPGAPDFEMHTQFPALSAPGTPPAKLGSAHARHYRTFLPNFTVIRQSWPDGDERLLLHIPTPNTRQSCTVFWSLAISPNFDGPPPQNQLDFAVRVLEEDRLMCENQVPPEVPINPTRGGWGVLIAPGDTLANTFQRSLRAWLLQYLPADAN